MIKKNNQTIDKIYKGSVEIAKIYKGLTLVYENYRDMVVSGNDVINIIKAKADSLNYLKRFGKCEQNGTPTPDSPVDIMCNNGAIKVGRETYTTPLGRTVYGGTLDVVTGELVVDKAMVDLGTLNWEIIGTRFKASVDGMPNKAGRTIKMLCDCYKSLVNGEAYDQNANNVCYGAYSSVYVHDFAYTDASIFKTAVTGHQLCYELATPQTYQLTPQTVGMIAEWSTFQSNASGNIDITYYANGILKTVSGNPVVITDADGQNAEDVTVHIEPIQSGSGTPSPTNIRPISGMTDINITRLGGVVADGTPEVLTVQGKNLFDDSHWGETLTSYNLLPFGSTSSFTYGIPIKGGQTYTGTVEIPSLSNLTAWGVYGKYENDSRTQVTFSQNTLDLKRTFTISSETDTKVIFWMYISRSNTWTNAGLTSTDQVKIQIESGSTATPYEPYSAQTASVENLLAVGNYKDEQDIISGLLTHKVGIKVLNGTEAFNTSTLINCYSLQDYLAEGTRDSRMVVCSHFWSSDILPASGAREGGAFLGFVNGRYTVGFGATGQFQTADAFKAWLAEQYANGTPVIIVYPLVTSTTETVTAQPVNIQKGANTIQVTQASINDLELEIKYKGK